MASAMRVGNIVRIAWLMMLLSQSQESRGQSGSSGALTMMSELGCGNCHTDLKLKNTLKERTPDLTSAGLRYNPAYLFDFLRNPVRVKHHLGRARMPNFQFNDQEALALVKFLQTQQDVAGVWPPLPPEIQTPAAAENVSKKDF